MKKSIVSFIIVTLLFSTTALSVEAKTVDIYNGEQSNEITYLPANLLSDNTVNPSLALENFLNSCSNKKVKFPSGKTFILEKQLVLHNINNLEIDFNGCTLKLPNGCDWKVRWDTGEYVPVSAITVHDSSNITFKDYTIDGNSTNIPADQWCIGLWISNTNGFSSINGSFKYCNYHQIVICSGTKDINFAGTLFKDHGGASSPAGISDVYVANNPDDNFSFIDTTINNTTLKDRQAQCFYISGYNGLIDTVNAINCSVPLDVRKGTHIARNFTITNAEIMLMVQPNPNDSTEFANLTASNFIGTNITGNSCSASGVYIVGCEKVHLDNFKIDMDPISKYSWYGFRIRKFYNEYPLKDITVTNIKVSNSQIAGFMMENLVNSITVNSFTSVNTPYAFKTSSCAVKQYVGNLTAVNGKTYDSKDKMIKKL